MRLAADFVSPSSLAGKDEDSRLNSVGTAANSGTSAALACWCAASDMRTSASGFRSPSCVPGQCASDSLLSVA
eukprot:1990311-Pleurochrysis_carterae.AAC.2